MKKVFVCLISFIAISTQLWAQNFPNTETEFKDTYEKNIKKSRINGVYIPKDIDDAFQELDALSTQEARAKYRSGDEDLVVSRLKMGIGQWMIVNWNFYEGSRLSHYIKEIGVTHPEDMSEFMMRLYHRYLLGKDVDQKALADKIESTRKLARKAERSELPIIYQETRIKKKG